MIVVLMGVSGCGKSTVGAALADDLRWTFLDADDFHPAANIARMAAGTPLTDEDRWPWLDRIVVEIRRALESGGHAVLACSALRRAYRARLSQAGALRFVHLRGDHDTISARLAARRHRYMPAALLGSQFATLEIPGDATDIDIRMSISEQVAAIESALGLSRPGEASGQRDAVSKPRVAQGPPGS
jgi:gluconokinase